MEIRDRKTYMKEYRKAYSLSGRGMDREQKKAYMKAYKKAYYKSEKGKAYLQSEKYKTYMKSYMSSEKRKVWKRNYAKSEKNQEYNRNYRKLKKAKSLSNQYRNEYQKKRLKENPAFKIRKNLSVRLYHAVKGNKKFKGTVDLIGCDINYLKNYLQSKFTEGMSWENYGKWHIDHKRPCASFDLSKLEQQMECFNYKNLQPLWALDNNKKYVSLTWK